MNVEEAISDLKPESLRYLTRNKQRSRWRTPRWQSTMNWARF